MENEKKTLAELTQEAIDVQDACNLSGVVHGWSRSITELRACLKEAGTDDINTHFINILWADKVAHLTGTQTIGHDKVMRAYSDAYKVIGR